MSDIEARKEAVQIALVMLISSFFITLGAVMLGLGEGFILAAVPNIVDITENAKGNLTDSTITILLAYDAQARNSIQLIYAGGALIATGFIIAIGVFVIIIRRMPRP